MKALRVSIVTHKFVRDDGQGRVNYEVAKALWKRGHRLTLIGSQVESELKELPGIDLLEISTSGWPTELARKQIFAVRSTFLVRKARPDILIVNGYITWARADLNAVHFVHAAWLKSPLRHRRKSLRSFYQSFYTMLNTKLELVAFRRCKKLIAVSNRVSDQLVELGISASQIVVIENGVDIMEFVPEVEPRRPLGLPERVPLALFVGDLQTYRKNLDGVLNALQDVHDLHLAVAGSIEGSPFPSLASKLGVSNRVHFLGHRTDIARVMRASDFFVFPTRFDPFGLVILEAMASGLPIITSVAAGASSLVTQDCGFVLESSEDRNSLVEAMRRLATDDELRARFGVAARLVAEERSWQAIAAQYVDLVESLGRS